MLARLFSPTRERFCLLSKPLCTARLNSTVAQPATAGAAAAELELSDNTAATGIASCGEMESEPDMSRIFSVFPRASDISLDQLPGASNFGRKTYSVARSSTGNLPVYSEYKSGKVYTEVRKISGDIIQLRDDLQQRLPKIPRDSWTVIMQSKKLLIKGYYLLGQRIFEAAEADIEALCKGNMVHAQFSTPALRPTIYDENEVLMSSFLVKRPTQSTSSLDEQQDIASVLHHNMLWKSNHRYWCVLRRGQFSYYKDQTERKAERVVLVADLLYCRIYDENMLDLYTREKTFRFKADDYALAQKWEQAFKQVMQGRGESTVAEPVGEESCLAGDLPADVVRPKEEAGPSRQEEDEEEEDDGFDVVCETDFEAAPPRTEQLSAAEQRSSAASDVASVNNGVISEEDKAFYEAYNPQGNERLIQSGLLYGQVRNSIRRKKWKPFKGELTNRHLKLVSVATSQVFATIDLAEVVDCVELDKNDPCFALIVTTQRLKFKAKTDEELVDWIINIKSSVIVRERLPQAPQ